MEREHSLGWMETSLVLESWAETPKGSIASGRAGAETDHRISIDSPSNWFEAQGYRIALRSTSNFVNENLRKFDLKCVGIQSVADAIEILPNLGVSGVPSGITATLHNLQHMNHFHLCEKRSKHSSWMLVPFNCIQCARENLSQNGVTDPSRFG